MGHPVRMDAMSRAVRLARRLGVSVDMAVPLRSTNNNVASGTADTGAPIINFCILKGAAT